MDSLIKYKIPLVLLFFVCQVVWVNSGSNLLQLETISVYSWLSLFFLFLFWLLLVSDLIIRDIHHKAFWMIAMLVLPAFAPAAYLFLRKKRRTVRSTYFKS